MGRRKEKGTIGRKHWAVRKWGRVQRDKVNGESWSIFQVEMMLLVSYSGNGRNVMLHLRGRTELANKEHKNRKRFILYSKQGQPWRSYSRQRFSLRRKASNFDWGTHTGLGRKGSFATGSHSLLSSSFYVTCSKNKWTVWLQIPLGNFCIIMSKIALDHLKRVCETNLELLAGPWTSLWIRPY